MYQLGTKWKLWELQNALQEDVEAITLRGFDLKPPISLPADFYGVGRRLSVEKISSQYCPTRRDLYFQVIERINPRSENKTWGQTAGHVIESYCKGILDYFEDSARSPESLRYQVIHDLAEEYTKAFWQKSTKSISDLRKKSSNSNESPERLFFLLQQTAKYELSLLGADFSLSGVAGQDFVPLLESIPLRFDENDLKISPNPGLGLSEITSPDFMILNPVPIMGDIKSGSDLKSFHLTTIAGYALAFESQHNIKIDFGIVYFFCTHTSAMNFAQSYVFVIDDVLRKQFLAARDAAYSLLQKDDRPPLVEEKYYDTFCKWCKYNATCYPKTPN